MRRMLKMFRPVLVSFAVFTVLCGVVYTGVVTAVAQALFPGRANGSIITLSPRDGTERSYGSSLIGQEFTKPGYLIGRPMGTTNLSPLSLEQSRLVGERVSFWRSLDPGNGADIPADLVTASGSGADPYISPEAAEYQAARIAAARGIGESEVRAIIDRHTRPRFLGVFGEPGVNVLEVNLALDGLR
jgi:K+-transporting ATPase ATPase C chain